MKYMMTMLIIFILAFSACEDKMEVEMMEEMEEEMEAMPDTLCLYEDDRSLNLVTGIKFSDANGQSIGQVGNPNSSADSPILVFPIPNNGIFQIAKNNNVDYDLYIIPAEKDTLCPLIDFMPYDFMYSVDSLVVNDDSPIAISSNNLSIQVGVELPKGYYRLIFVDEAQNSYIENYYFDPAMTANETYEFLIENF